MKVVKGIKEKVPARRKPWKRDPANHRPREVENPIVIENVTPEIEGGRFRAKGIAGEPVRVEADIFKDGHDVLGARLKYKKKGEDSWNAVPVFWIDNDRWRGQFVPAENAQYLYSIEAWVDLTATWLRNTEKKSAAYPSVQSGVLEGLEFLKKIRKSAGAHRREEIERWRKLLQVSEGRSTKVLNILRDPAFGSLLKEYPVTAHPASYENLELTVDRKRAEFSAWYEIFPRSQGKVPGRSATFRDCIERLSGIREMGFDVLYLAPIHPIGRTHRKGPNNTLTPEESAPGSPWAIGSPEGGHKSVHPDLGSMEDFEALVGAAESCQMEIALDLAFQCSPDHPYVKDHPEWFCHLPDGSIRYAENPPKKYEDIYPFNFYSEQKEALWNELKSIVLFWIGKGVKIFRVDNPHTKPLRFWQWLIEEIQEDHPEVIFLAEAFTRPKVMKFLAKTGFTQSYTYFTWRNAKAELRQYLEELTQTGMAEYFRGNFFANTPDILPEYLQKGGRPAFKVRLVLAATLSSSYGIYSGFELCENQSREPGSEEYRDSEKYQYKVWDWERPGHIKDFIAKVNRIRHENPGLQQYKNLEFYDSGNDAVLCYGKRTADDSNRIVVAVNLDPFRVQEDTVILPLEKWGIGTGRDYEMKDLLTGHKYTRHGARNYIRLDPEREPAHIFLVTS